MKQYVLLFFFCVAVMSMAAQETISGDSAKILEAVVVRGYEQNRRLLEISAPVSVIGKPQLERFSNTSLLPAINTAAGVRMEERSPGSYRLNIRGSSLRSPFGVRNVKVYWNNIPFTDAGGNTYLNQLSFQNVNSIEIIKGPASSIYGAGTGGAVILKSLPAAWKPGISLNYLAGSYDQQMINSSIQWGSDAVQNTLTYTHHSVGPGRCSSS